MTKENKPYKLSQLAGMMCNDAQFREFIKDHYLADGTDKDTAAVFVREYCGVESRSLLDSNDTAGAIFKDMLNVFDAWKQARGNEG